MHSVQASGSALSSFGRIRYDHTLGANSRVCVSDAIANASRSIGNTPGSSSARRSATGAKNCCSPSSMPPNANVLPVPWLCMLPMRSYTVFACGQPASRERWPSTPIV